MKLSWICWIRFVIPRLIQLDLDRHALCLTCRGSTKFLADVEKRLSDGLSAGKVWERIRGKLAMAGLAAIHQARIIDALQLIVLVQCGLAQLLGGHVELAVQH